MNRARAMGIGLFITVIAVMGRLCFSEFTWYDDPATVHHNPSMNPPTLEKMALYWKSWGSRAPLGLYIPLTYSTWSLLAKVAYVEQADEWNIHLNPWLFHTANVVIHGLSAVLVFMILRLLIRGDFAALIGAMVFGVHPVQVEAVGWVSGLKDVLCGMLSLIALWQYILFALHAGAERTRAAPDSGFDEGKIRGGANTLCHGVKRGRWYLAIATVAMVLAMFSKPTAVVVPMIALIIDVLVIRRPMRRAVVTLLPWFLLIIPCMIWTKVSQPGTGVPTASLWVRPMIALDSLAFYLWKLILPLGLTVDHGRTPVKVFERGWWMYTWAAPVLVGLVIWLSRKWRGMLLAAGLIFVAGVGPVLGFTPFLFQIFSGVADHYLYLSMLGVALAVALSVSVYPRKVAALVWAMVLLVLCGLTIRQTGFWYDDLTLWRHNIEVNPSSGLAQLNYGAALYRAGDMQRAEQQFREAIRIDPEDAAAYDNLAMVMIRTGRNERAIEYINRVIEINQNQSTITRAKLESTRQSLRQVEQQMKQGR